MKNFLVFTNIVAKMLLDDQVYVIVVTQNVCNDYFGTL